MIALDKDLAETMRRGAVSHTFLGLVPEVHEDSRILLESLLTNLAPAREHIVDGVIGERGEGIDDERTRSSDTSETRKTAIDVCDFLAFPDWRAFAISHIQDEGSGISSVVLVEVLRIGEEVV